MSLATIETQRGTITLQLNGRWSGEETLAKAANAIATLSDATPDVGDPVAYVVEQVSQMIPGKVTMRDHKPQPNQVYAAIGAAAEQAFLERYAAKDDKSLRWITVHPPGHDKGQPVLIDGKGRIQAGMGGKHTGKTLGEISKGGSGKEPPKKKKKKTGGSDAKPIYLTRSMGKMSRQEAEATAPRKGDRFERKGQMYEVTKASKPKYVTEDWIDDTDSFHLKPGWVVNYTAKPVEKTEAEKKTGQAKQEKAEKAERERKEKESRFTAVAEAKGMNRSESWPLAQKEPTWEKVLHADQGESLFVGELADGTKVARRSRTMYDDFRETFYVPEKMIKADAKRMEMRSEVEELAREASMAQIGQMTPEKKREVAEKNEQLTAAIEKLFDAHGELPASIHHRLPPEMDKRLRAVQVKGGEGTAAEVLASRELRKKEPGRTDAYVVKGGDPGLVKQLHDRADEIEKERLQEFRSALGETKLDDDIRKSAEGTVHKSAFLKPSLIAENTIIEQRKRDREKREKSQKPAPAGIGKPKPSGGRQSHDATWAKLRNGKWGARIRSREDVQEGDKVTVTARSGRTKTTTVANVVWAEKGRGQRVHLVEVYGVDAAAIERDMADTTHPWTVKW